MRRGDNIPSVSEYAHWNEDAEAVWYAENRYDMEHADEELEDDWYEQDEDFEEPEDDGEPDMTGWCLCHDAPVCPDEWNDSFYEEIDPYE